MTILRCTVMVGAVLALSVTGLALSADDILERVEDQGFLGIGVGDFQGEFTLKLEEPDEEPEEYRFRVWSREEEDGTVKTNLLYMAPPLVEGTMFLFHSEPGKDPRMWLMLPELQMVKELVGDAAEDEFVAGTGVSYEEIAEGFAYRNGYQSELVDEVQLDDVPCWKIEVIPEELEAEEWSSILLWVHREEYVVMRADFIDEDGEVARRMLASELDEDEIGVFPRLVQMEDLRDGTFSEIRIYQRSKEEVAEDYFRPDRLLELEI